MNKKELRKKAMSDRKKLSPEKVAALSAELLNHFQQLNFEEIKTIHLFLPISEKQEPDTFLFIDWLNAAHPDIKIIVPRADFDQLLMTHHPYTGKHNLEKNIFNILEPQAHLLHTGTVDLVVVPLLAFDLRGYRVGYGKGFYDRFLSPLDVLKVGLSFFPPVEKIDDVSDQDIRLDLCLTPEGPFEF